MTNDRRPSRVPVRGSLVLALTIGGLALLMGFRSPEDASSDVALAIEPSSNGAGTSLALGTDTTAATTATASPSASAGASASPSASASAAPTASPTPEPSASATPSAEATATTQTATGSAFKFRYGIVQVSVTLEGGDIVDVQALQLPDGDRHSASISQQVEPMLRESALTADSANIDIISGATYTSLAYSYSLQSALDQLAAG